MEEAYKYDLIEKWLSDELNPKELLEFQQYQRSHPNWEQEVRLHQQMASLLGDASTLEIRQTLAAVDKEWQAPGTGPRVSIFSRRVLGIAASFLVLAGVFGVYYFTRPLSMSELYASYYEEYPMLLSQRSEAQNETNQLLSTAILAYQNREFQTACAQFSQLRRSAPENAAYTFYLGLCYLELDKTQEAILTFQELLALEAGPYLELTRWYLALAYLDTEQVDLARSAFTEIKAGQFKYEEAQKILNSL